MTTEMAFWRSKRGNLAAEFEARRYLLDTALKYIEWACDQLEDRNHVVLLVAAMQLLRLYDAHVSNEHAMALDVVALYGSLLERSSSDAQTCHEVDSRITEAPEL